MRAAVPDAKTKDEIEITPAMKSAGSDVLVSVIQEQELGFMAWDGPEILAERVYRAMSAASPASAPGTVPGKR